MLKVAIALITAVVFGADGWAQESTPETVARSYFDAMSRNDTAALARRMHPVALTQFQSLLLPMFEGKSADRVSSDLLPMFDGVSTAADLRRLSPEAFYASFMSGVAKVNPRFLQIMKESRYEILGYVPEKDNSHVVYRLEMTVEGQIAKRVAVLSLRKTGTTWGVLLTTEAEGMATSLRRKYR